MEEMMRNEEIMDVVEEVVPTSGSGLGTKILGGAIIAGAVIAGYKLVKKYWPKKETNYVEPNVDMSHKVSNDEYVVEAIEVEDLNEKLK